MSPTDPPRKPEDPPPPARDARPDADATQEPDWVNDADRASQEPQEDGFLGPPRRVPSESSGD